jgi:hypothetical protein
MHVEIPAGHPSSGIPESAGVFLIEFLEAVDRD